MPQISPRGSTTRLLLQRLWNIACDGDVRCRTHLELWPTVGMSESLSLVQVPTIVTSFTCPVLSASRLFVPHTWQESKLTIFLSTFFFFSFCPNFFPQNNSPPYPKNKNCNPLFISKINLRYSKYCKIN